MTVFLESWFAWPPICQVLDVAGYFVTGAENSTHALHNEKFSPDNMSVQCHSQARHFATETEYLA